MKAGSSNSSAGLWNTVRNKNKALIFTKLISNLGFGSPEVSWDSGYICNAVPADWHWKTIPHRPGGSTVWAAQMGTEIPTMVQFDRELWKKLPRRKRRKWDANIRGQGREHLKTWDWQTTATTTQAGSSHAIVHKGKSYWVKQLLLPLGETGAKVGAGMNQKVQMQKYKSVIIPLLPLKTIPCWNVAVRQICRRF